MRNTVRRWATAALIGAAVSVPAVALAQTSSSAEDAAGAAVGLGILGIYSVMCFFYVLGPILALVGLALWIVAIIDVAQRNEWEFPQAIQGRPTGNEKVLWLLVVLLAGMIGAIVYYFSVMKKYPRGSVGAPPVVYPSGVPPIYRPGAYPPPAPAAPAPAAAPTPAAPVAPAPPPAAPPAADAAPSIVEPPAADEPVAANDSVADGSDAASDTAPEDCGDAQA